MRTELVTTEPFTTYVALATCCCMVSRRYPRKWQLWPHLRSDVLPQCRLVAGWLHRHLVLDSQRSRRNRAVITDEPPTLNTLWHALRFLSGGAVLDSKSGAFELNSLVFDQLKHSNGCIWCCPALWHLRAWRANRWLAPG